MTTNVVFVGYAYVYNNNYLMGKLILIFPMIHQVTSLAFVMMFVLVKRD